jgi:hypothetical protein
MDGRAGATDSFWDLRERANVTGGAASSCRICSRAARVVEIGSPAVRRENVNPAQNSGPGGMGNVTDADDEGGRWV